jgi:hypothetical protein
LSSFSFLVVVVVLAVGLVAAVGSYPSLSCAPFFLPGRRLSSRSWVAVVAAVVVVAALDLDVALRPLSRRLAVGREEYKKKKNFGCRKDAP